MLSATDWIDLATDKAMEAYGLDYTEGDSLTDLPKEVQRALKRQFLDWVQEHKSEIDVVELAELVAEYYFGF